MFQLSFFNRDLAQAELSFRMKDQLAQWDMSEQERTAIRGDSQESVHSYIPSTDTYCAPTMRWALLACFRYVSEQGKASHP